jgi:predicted phage baseplate assembly protein
MSLPAPNLDDRRAQDIVDEAKRRIAALVPGWTDHNVSDPGVALIELFAWMTDMMLYRLNQVPDRLYVKFLELVGIELFSAVPSRGELVFTLTAPQASTVRIPAGTQVSTERSGDDEPVVFSTERDLDVVPPDLVA